MKRILKILPVLFLFLFFQLYAIPYTLFPAYAACDPKVPIAQRSTDCPAGLDQIESVFSNVISIIVGFGFITLLIMLIMAGIRYITSGGDPKTISSAHQTVTWALLGIVFMAIAWLVLQLIAAFTGIDVTIFDVKKLCVAPLNAFCQAPTPAPAVPGIPNAI